MANITQTLLKLKLQQAVDCLVVKGKKLRIKWQCSEDTNDMWEELTLIANYLNILERHDLSSDLNCLTDKNVENILNHLHSLCENCKIAYLT